MMRAGSGVFAGVAALIAVTVSACGQSAPNTSASELFQEYVKSTNVIHDRFPSTGTSKDRLANFAASYSPEQLQSQLLAAMPCDAGANCPAAGEAGKVVKDFAGAKGTAFQRTVLVKHHDGSLELIWLFVARDAAKDTALVDSNGDTYTGGLEDFRRNNDVLGSDDLVLTLRDITATPGKGRIVAVSGHTTSWKPWVIGGVLVAVVLGAVLAVTRRLVTRRRAAAVGE